MYSFILHNKINLVNICGGEYILLDSL
jgi:hypothetical protein